MKARILAMLLLAAMAACKKDSKNDPNKNGGNGSSATYGTGKNSLTITIGDEKPFVLKGENILDDGIWGSMYQWPVRRLNYIIKAEKSEYPVKIKLDYMDVLVEPAGTGVGNYIIGNTGTFDEGDNYKGRRFKIDSGRLEVTKVEPLGNKLASVQGSFTIWAVGTNKETGEKKNEMIKGELDYKEADYDVQ